MVRRVKSENLGGWIVEAVWESEQLESGPTTVTIHPSPRASERARRLGINSGVMRRAEQAVREMVSELDVDGDTKYRDALQGRVDSLPPGGPRRGGDNYYRALLELFEEIELISRSPSRDIALAMGVSPKTVRSQIQRARELEV